MELSELSEEQVYDRLRERYQVMVASAQKALSQPQKMVLGLIEGQASCQRGSCRGDRASAAGSSMN